MAEVVAEVVRVVAMVVRVVSKPQRWCGWWHRWCGWWKRLRGRRKNRCEDDGRAGDRERGSIKSMKGNAPHVSTKSNTK